MQAGVSQGSAEKRLTGLEPLQDVLVGQGTGKEALGAPPGDKLEFWRREEGEGGP